MGSQLSSQFCTFQAISNKYLFCFDQEKSSCVNQYLSTFSVIDQQRTCLPIISNCFQICCSMLTSIRFAFLFFDFTDLLKFKLVLNSFFSSNLDNFKVFSLSSSSSCSGLIFGGHFISNSFGGFCSSTSFLKLARISS